MLKKIVFSILIFLSLPVGAATWYVRPASGEYGAEDGTSYATAFDGTADIVWGVSGVNAGDTLCVDGTFTGASESDVSGITLRVDQSGTAGNFVTIDGDCDGDGVKAQFDGNNEVGIAIRTAIVGTSRTTYLSIKNIVMRQYTNKAVVTYSVTGDETADANQTWDSIEVYDHGDGGAGDNGFDSRGRYITLTNSTFTGIDEDAIYHKGKYFRADNIVVRDFSRATTGGDGIQLTGEIDGYHVSNFDCLHERDTKQCFITSVLTDTGAGGILEDFRADCPRGATVMNCVFATGDGAKIRRGYITGGNYGLAIEASPASVNMEIGPLLIDGATVDNFGLFADTGGGNILVTHVTSINAGRYAFAGSTGPSATYKNNVAVNSGTCGFNLAASGQTETYNRSYQAGLSEFCQGGVATTAGTGSAVADPAFLGGPAPSTALGFRPKPNSPLLGAGTYSDAKYDYNGVRFGNPPNIGAFATTPDNKRSSYVERY